jgi:hypothetical protein
MDGTLQLIVNIGAACTALAAVIGLPIVLVKLWPHIKRGVTVLSELERLPEMADSVEAIRHEVFPNSGKSLRDAVDQQGRDLKAHIDACPPAPTTTINVNGGTA